MKIGLPKEIKEQEYRVAIIPSNVSKLVDMGHTVYVEHDAGKMAGYSDEEYKAAGAILVDSEKEVFEKADLITKVKEILPSEFGLLKENHILFTYIHSSTRRPETEDIMNSKCIAFAMEDMKDPRGRFPLLEPMSRIAGEMAFTLGYFYSLATQGGNGVAINGASGVKPAKVVIFGCGFVGTSAAKLACGLNADVVVMDVNTDKMQDLMENKLPHCRTKYSNKQNVIEEIKDADIVLNCTKWFKGLTIISRDMLKYMKPNAIIVDADAEPHGAIETAEFTTHEDPIKVVDGIRHICIPNLPSAVSHTSSATLSNASIDYIAMIANKGWKKAVLENTTLENGLDFARGYLTWIDTAESLNIPLTDKKWIYENFE